MAVVDMSSPIFGNKGTDSNNPADQARLLQKGVTDLTAKLNHAMSVVLGHVKGSDHDLGGSGSKGPSA